MLFQHLEQFALGEFDALDQRLHLRIALRAQFGTHGFEGALHIVGDRQHVAGETGIAVEPRVGDLALGAFAQVFHLGQRAQQLVLVFGSLAHKLGHGDLLGRPIPASRLRPVVFGLGTAVSAWRAVGSVIVLDPSNGSDAGDIRVRAAKNQAFQPDSSRLTIRAV